MPSSVRAAHSHTGNIRRVSRNYRGFVVHRAPLGRAERVSDNGVMDFSAEARLVHAGTERTAGAPLAPPLLATSTYV